MQSYFPDGAVTAAPYAGQTQIPLEPEPIYSRKKGEKSEVVATYDAEFRAGFDRKITEWAMRLHDPVEGGGQALLRLPALHPGPHPADPGPASTRARPSAGTGPTSSPRWTTSPARSSTSSTSSGVAEDTIVVWASDNGADTTLPLPSDRPGSGGRSMARVLWALAGRVVHRAGGLQPDAVHRPLAREGARRQGQQRDRARGRLVHHAGESRRWRSTRRPADRRHGHDATSCWVMPRSRAATSSCACRATGCRRRSGISGRSTCSSRTTSTRPGSRTTCRILYNLEWDPREEHQVDFPHAWVLHPVAAAAGAFLKSLVVEPPIKPGTPDPYVPPKPGELRPETHLQIGPILQYITTLVRLTTSFPTPATGSRTSTDERRPQPARCPRGRRRVARGHRAVRSPGVLCRAEAGCEDPQAVGQADRAERGRGPRSGGRQDQRQAQGTGP